MAKNTPSFTPSITALQQVVYELSNSGKSQYLGVLFPVHTRLKSPVFGMLTAFTEHSGSSRNHVVNQILEVGIEAILKSLPDDIVDSLYEKSTEAIEQGIQKQAHESGEV